MAADGNAVPGLKMISVTRLFEFILVAVGIGSLALLLTAVLLTASKR